MLTVLGQWASNLRIAYDRHRAVEAFSKLSDGQLLDIGIERNAIEEQVRRTMPWRCLVPEHDVLPLCLLPAADRLACGSLR